MPVRSPYRTAEDVEGAPLDLLDLYFRGLGLTALLTAEEEVELAKKIEARNEAREKLRSGAGRDRRRMVLAVEEGDKAFDQFVQANLRLVVNIAAQFARRSSLSFDELIQEGNVGLIRAVEKFDWRRGFKFSTYATWWIRQALQRAVADKSRAIRLPVAMHDAVTKIRAAQRRLEAEGTYHPTHEQLAEATNLTVAEVRKAFRSDWSVTSLDQSVGDAGGDQGELADFAAVAPDRPADEAVDAQYGADFVGFVRARLTDKQWDVVRRFVGLDGAESETLEQISVSMGVSREMVRRTRENGYSVIREALKDGPFRADD